MHPITNIAAKAARAAGEIISRSFERLEKTAILEKTAHDFVTEVDQWSEREIIRTIRMAYPDHAVLGEEGGSDGKSDYEWIIDPLDGTINYIHGFPYFCVSIGVKYKGVLEYGVVYDPLTHELFYASRGDGAYLNDRRIRVSKTSSLKDALLMGSFPIKQREEVVVGFKFIEAVFRDVAGVRLTGAAALNLANVAAGRLDCCWVFNAGPWDMAAGLLLVKEAGGLCSDFEGKEDYFTNGTVIAGTPKVFKEFLKIAKPIVEKWKKGNALGT